MARVYVGTYAKYNNGSIAGQWIDIEQFDNYNDFVAECRRIHKDENDPEFMIQDYEDFPDGLGCGEWLSEKDFNDVIQALKEEEPICRIVYYSEKAIAVVGDTIVYKDKFKQLGGRFNPRLSCGAGWIFSKKVEKQLKEILNGGNVEHSTTKNTDCKELIDEYLAEMRKVWGEDSRMMDYEKKRVSAVYRLSNGDLICFEKPNIETSFCFGYSDSAYDTKDYDNANAMAHHAATSEEYFLEQNLKCYDGKIKNIEEGDEYIHICIFRKSYTSQKGLLNVFNWGCLKYWQYYEAKNIHPSSYPDLQEVNAEDRAIILNALKSERAKFEKRLKAYLKRYGLSKIKTWSYWRDA